MTGPTLPFNAFPPVTKKDQGFKALFKFAFHLQSKVIIQNMFGGKMKRIINISISIFERSQLIKYPCIFAHT